MPGPTEILLEAGALICVNDMEVGAYGKTGRTFRVENGNFVRELQDLTGKMRLIGNLL